MESSEISTIMSELIYVAEKNRYRRSYLFCIISALVLSSLSLSTAFAISASVFVHFATIHTVQELWAIEKATYIIVLLTSLTVFVFAALRRAIRERL